MAKIMLYPLCKESNVLVGGGNEEYYINLITDELLPYLKSSGIKCDKWIQGTVLSQIYDICLILSLNCKNQDDTNSQGVDIQYLPMEASGYRFAKLLHKSFNEIYPQKNKIRISPCDAKDIPLKSDNPKVMVKLGYRDDLEDSNWLKENIEKIVENLAASIAEYFAQPFVLPTKVEQQILNTDTKIYSQPCENSEIVAVVPSGTKIDIIGRWCDWCVTDIDGKAGYINTKI